MAPPEMEGVVRALSGLIDEKSADRMSALEALAKSKFIVDSEFFKGD
jgi:hypothetical protein